MDGRKATYKETVMGRKAKEGDQIFGTWLDGEFSNDDIIKECEDETCIGVGMTHEEKLETRRPWLNSLIIKLVGRSIGYHYLWRHFQAMWRTQAEPLLIDLGNNFFICETAE